MKPAISEKPKKAQQSEASKQIAKMIREVDELSPYPIVQLDDIKKPEYATLTDSRRLFATIAPQGFHHISLDGDHLMVWMPTTIYVWILEYLPNFDIHWAPYLYKIGWTSTTVGDENLNFDLSMPAISAMLPNTMPEGRPCTDVFSLPTLRTKYSKSYSVPNMIADMPFNFWAAEFNDDASFFFGLHPLYKVAAKDYHEFPEDALRWFAEETPEKICKAINKVIKSDGTNMRTWLEREEDFEE